MSDLSLDVVSAHRDYTPNAVDYDISVTLISGVIGDYDFTISVGADDSAFLRWGDGVANEWLEHYERISHAIARLANLQYCAESNWKVAFDSTPVQFAEKFKFLMNDPQVNS